MRIRKLTAERDDTGALSVYIVRSNGEREWIANFTVEDDTARCLILGATKHEETGGIGQPDHLFTW